MQDRPTIDELLDALRRFVEHDVVPNLSGGRQFHARVAANVLAIIGRELRDGDGFLRAEWRRLDALSGAPAGAPPSDAAELRAAVVAMNEALAARIRAGDVDDEPARAAVVAHLRATIEEKLRIANPRYLEESDAGGAVPGARP